MLLFEKLLDYYEGLLTDDEAEEVRLHVAECPECALQVAQFQQYLPALNQYLCAVSLPESVVQRAIRIGTAPPSWRTSAGPLIIAKLLFDSRRAQHIPVGVRSSAPVDVQMIFRAGDHDIDIWQERVNDSTWYLNGQILSTEGAEHMNPDAVRFTTMEGAVYDAVTDNDEFFVRALPAGTYDIRLALSGRSILLYGVEVGGKDH
jgi:hypothetical protein